VENSGSKMGGYLACYIFACHSHSNIVSGTFEYGSVLWSLEHLPRSAIPNSHSMH